MRKLNNDKELSLFDILGFFKDNARDFFLYFLVFLVLLFTYFLFFIRPVYKVDSKIEVNEFGDSISLNPMSFMLGDSSTSSMITEEELFKSRLIVDKVIEKCNLRAVIRKDYNNMFVYIVKNILGMSTDSGGFFIREFPDSFIEDLSLTVLSASEYKISLSDKDQICKWGESCFVEDKEINIEKIGTLQEGSTFSIEHSPTIVTRIEFLKRLSAKNYTGTKNIDLSYSDENPYLASKVLSIVIDVYESIKKEWDKKEISDKKKYIQSILGDVKKEIKEKAEKLVEYQKNNETISPDLKIEALIKQIGEIKIKISSIQLTKKILTKVIDELRNDSFETITIPSMSGDLSMVELINAHNNLVLKRDSLAEQLTDKHPQIVGMNNEIKESVKNLSDLLKQQIKVFTSSEKALENEITGIMAENSDIPEKILRSEALKNDLNLTEKLYVALTSKLYESTIDKKTGVPPIKVIDYPTAEVLRKSPKIFISFIVMVLISFVLSFLAIFLKEIFRVRVFNKRQVDKIFGEGEAVSLNINEESDLEFFTSVLKAKMEMSDQNVLISYSTEFIDKAVGLIQKNIPQQKFIIINEKEGVSLKTFLTQAETNNLNKSKVMLKVENDLMSLLFKNESFLNTVRSLSQNDWTLFLCLPFSSIDSFLRDLNSSSLFITFFVESGKTPIKQIQEFAEFILDNNEIKKLIIYSKTLD